MTVSKWPLEPVLAALEQFPEGIQSLAMKRGASQERAAQIANAFLRAEKRVGSLTLRMADVMCIDVLGVHPYQIYGELWFSPEMDEPVGEVYRKDLKPCWDCGGPKEHGLDQKHFCAACHEKRWACACGCGERKSSEGAKYAHRSHQFRKAAA